MNWLALGIVTAVVFAPAIIIQLVCGPVHDSEHVAALLFRTREQQPDEHAQWLGADAGGSFIHNGSVSE